MKDLIKSQLTDSANLKLKIAEELADQIAKVAELIINSYQKGGKLILFGNGGSAADAQHIAGELVGRFKMERHPLPAIALHTDTSALTAIGNDYGFENVFARQLEAWGKPNDVALGISTSGNSKNVVNAIKRGNELGLKTIGLSGGNGGNLAKIAQHYIIVPSYETPRIQEAHITIGHIICDIVERTLFEIGR